MTKLALLLSVAAACGDPLPPITGTQALQIDLVSPADTGAIDSRICSTLPCPQAGQTPTTSATVNVTAIGPDGQMDASYTNDVQVYVNFLGTLTPYLCDPTSAAQCNALATIHVQDGIATNAVVPLPPVFGPSTLWFDDGDATAPTYATGSSPVMWFRDPFVEDTQRPADENALDALDRSPLVDPVTKNGKNVDIRASRYGSRGRLVVTSVFAQGYTLADVQCADDAGNPPCVSQDYDYEEVFSFSAAKDGIGCFLVEGQVIDGFAGGVSDFDGLTEVGFPQTFVDHGQGGDCTKIDVNPAREPKPAVLDQSWFTNKIIFERNEAGLIEIDGATLCDLDSDFDEFNQWKIDPSGVGGDCSKNKNVLNIITAGVVQSADKPTLTGLAGHVVPKVVGTLRPINIGTFDVWIVYPRGDADVKLQ